MQSKEDIKVYIVEDSMVVALELSENLKKQGYHVTGSSASGEKAVQEVLRLQPDVVLMDIYLQEKMDGIEAADIIQRECDVPVIFTTAYSDDDTIFKVKKTNPYGYLLKPYNYRELFMLLEMAVRKSRFRKELKASEMKFRRLFEESRDPIYLFNREGKIVDANESFLYLFQVTKDELPGIDYHDYFLDKEECRTLVNKIEAGEQVRDMEFRMKKKGGDEIFCLLSASQFSVSEKPDILLQGIVRDITAWKNTEKKLNQSLSNIQETLKGIVSVVARTIDFRDPFTSGHQKRVARLAVALAEKMGCNEKTIEGIYLAGQIHDIGKIAVPAEILSMPRRLTGAEYRLVQQHPKVAQEILEGIKFPWPLAEIIYRHHERLDGSGYPEGLKGDEIIMEARIIAVADVVEAMLSHRPYRGSLTIEDALEEISSKSGVLYDPPVVEHCVSLLKEKGFDVFSS